MISLRRGEWCDQSFSVAGVDFFHRFRRAIGPGTPRPAAYLERDESHVLNITSPARLDM